MSTTRQSDLTGHMGYGAVRAHLAEDHVWLLEAEDDAQGLAEILRGWHNSDHLAAGEPAHDIEGDPL